VSSRLTCRVCQGASAMCGQREIKGSQQECDAKCSPRPPQVSECPWIPGPGSDPVGAWPGTHRQLTGGCQALPERFATRIVEQRQPRTPLPSACCAAGGGHHSRPPLAGGRKKQCPPAAPWSSADVARRGSPRPSSSALVRVDRSVGCPPVIRYSCGGLREPGGPARSFGPRTGRLTGPLPSV